MYLVVTCRQSWPTGQQCMTDPVNTLPQRPVVRPRTPQIHLVHMQYLMHGHGSQKCVQSDVSRCHFHSSPARAASKQRRRDLLATYLCVCLWRHCFGASSYPLPASHCPLPARASEASCMCILLTLSAPTSDVYDDDVVLESVVLYG